MLSRLTIENIVLIERLDLELGPGLTALTGETGAGKSILLDAVGLVLGERAERSLVREGAERAAVSASFDLPERHAVFSMLDEADIAAEEGALVLRRALGPDGRGRGSVDDRPASAALMRALGGALVQIHGQYDQGQLASETAQRQWLDAYAQAESERGAVAAAYERLRAADAMVKDAEALRERAAREDEFLRHRADELRALAPEPGEEEALSAKRRRLMDRDRALAALADIDGLIGEARDAAQRAAHKLARAPLEPPPAEPAEALERALIELAEAEAQLGAAARAYDGGEDDLEAIEERLFALKDAARKYRAPIESLPALAEEAEAAAQGLERADAALAQALSARDDARAAYDVAASLLSAKRAAGASALAAAVTAELPPLKLAGARLYVRLEPVAQPSADGMERVRFDVVLNKGQEPSPLAKSASGGERSRLMLAIAVVSASRLEASTLIFDEIDGGMGGATADAVGERLARLARERQVLVVTHAPQVAARANAHWRVRKSERRGRAETAIERLDRAGRELEIARMLAGAEVTPAARAAARALLDAPLQKAAS